MMIAGFQVAGILFFSPDFVFGLFPRRDTQAITWLDNSSNNFKISWKNGYLRSLCSYGIPENWWIEEVSYTD